MGGFAPDSSKYRQIAVMGRSYRGRKVFQKPCGRKNNESSIVEWNRQFHVARPVSRSDYRSFCVRTENDKTVSSTGLRAFTKAPIFGIIRAKGTGTYTKKVLLPRS